MPVVPALSVLVCVYLMLNLTGATWLRFLAWMALGYVVYFAYSRSRSVLAASGATPSSRSTSVGGTGREIR